MRIEDAEFIHEELNAREPSELSDTDKEMLDAVWGLLYHARRFNEFNEKCDQIMSSV